MSRERAAVLGLLVLVALGILLLTWRSATVPPPPPAQVADETPPPSATRPMLARHAPPTPPTMTKAGAPPSADPPPIIDDILVEKPDVCSGEENLITVKAHTENGTDAYLHYVIDGQMGSSYPVRQWRHADKGLVGEHTITVFGRGNAATTVPLPDYEIKECQEELLVNVARRLRPNTQSEFDFVARVITPMAAQAAQAATAAKGGRAAAPAPFVPVKWTWTFGDGQSVTTTVPSVTHDFEARPQTALYSYFTVGVDIGGQDGTSHSGRTELALLNPGFEALAVKKLLALQIALTPRFPVLGDDGVVRQSVKLWHVGSTAVTIDRASATTYYVGGGGDGQPESVDVNGLLGQSIIPPGSDGIVAQLTLDTNTDPNVLSRNYRLEGHSEDGTAVSGGFSVMRPPPKPTATNSEPVDDPDLKAKIIAARAILHQDVVSDEDIWQLQREGKLGTNGAPPAAQTNPYANGQPSSKGPPLVAPGTPTTPATQSTSTSVSK